MKHGITGLALVGGVAYLGGSTLRNLVKLPGFFGIVLGCVGGIGGAWLAVKALD